MLFTILWFVGMAGVLSTAWVALPIPAAEMPLPLGVVKLLNMILPMFLLSVGVLAGVNLASQCGLSAPLAEAMARGDNHPITALKPQVVPGLVGGAFGGVAIATLSFLWRSSLPADFVTKAEELSQNTPLLTRILYGGITEEIIIRWGLMTFIVWVAWYTLQKSQGRPHEIYIGLAIVMSAFIFGVAHLPLVFAIGSQVTSALVSYIIIANAFFGLIAGYLYWQQGLESAMIAHITFHAVTAIINIYR
jgi:Type II CAAX prenyl endopeptidase Rce1-like